MARYTNGRTIIRCSEETAANLPKEWKPVKSVKPARRASSAKRSTAAPKTEKAAKPTEPAAPVEPETPEAVDATTPESGVGEPDKSWSIAQLRDYATENGIDVTGLKKHAEILDAVTTALAADDDDDSDAEEADGSDESDEDE